MSNATDRTALSTETAQIIREDERARIAELLLDKGRMLLAQAPSNSAGLAMLARMVRAS